MGLDPPPLPNHLKAILGVLQDFFWGGVLWGDFFID